MPRRPSPSSGTLSWPVHAHQHLAWWNPFFQYTSHVTQIFWVPNHAFPGWWLAALALLHARREIDSAILIVAFAFLFFWSPLAAAGAMPIVGYLVLRRDHAHLLRAPIVVPCLVALCFLPIVVYLGADAGSVPHFWLILMNGFASLYVAFIVIQIPQAAVVVGLPARARSGGAHRSPARDRAAAAHPGLSARRATTILRCVRRSRRSRFSPSRSRRSRRDLKLRDGIGRVAAVVTIVALSAVTPALEVQRALMVDTFAISDCNLLTTWRYLEPSTWLDNYLARPTGCRRGCWAATERRRPP